jgi:hypothetical protein
MNYRGHRLFAGRLFAGKLWGPPPAVGGVPPVYTLGGSGHRHSRALKRRRQRADEELLVVLMR